MTSVTWLDLFSPSQ